MKVGGTRRVSSFLIFSRSCSIAVKSSFKPGSWGAIVRAGPDKTIVGVGELFGKGKLMLVSGNLF